MISYSNASSKNDTENTWQRLKGWKCQEKRTKKGTGMADMSRHILKHCNFQENGKMMGS